MTSDRHFIKIQHYYGPGRYPTCVYVRTIRHGNLAPEVKPDFRQKKHGLLYLVVKNYRISAKNLKKKNTINNVAAEEIS